MLNPRNRKATGLLTVLGVCVLSPMAWAAEIMDTVNDVDTYALDEVTVTATRTEKKDIDVPATTSIYTNE